MGEGQRRLIACGVTALLVAVPLAFALPPVSVAGAAALCAAAVGLSWPSLAAWAVERLEHELDLRLAANRRVGLARLVDRDPIVRALAPDWYLVARRGTLASLVGDHRHAIPLLKRAIQLCPDEDLLPLRDELAISLIGFGADKEAEQLLRTMIAEGAESPERLGLLGHIMLRRNQSADAIALLERATHGVALGVAALRIRCDLAEAYARAGKVDEAQETMRVAREIIVPDDLELRHRVERASEVVERAAATMRALKAAQRH